MTRRKLLFGAGLIVAVLFAAACSLEGVGGLGTAIEEERDAQVTLDRSAAPAPPSELSDMIERILPSVVNVRVEAVSFDPFGEAQIGEGQGSGVVIDEGGVIITNNHVISGATEVEVVFNDGKRLDGTVVGTAPEDDIAVIEVDSDEALPALEIGTSDPLRLGDEVVAVGFPLGLGGPTVTKGIISAEDRTISVRQDNPNLPDQLRGLLQTDAAINPGNSGGALVDINGKLIGINTAAASAGSAENVGFAIPIDTALPIAQEILEDPPDERAYLGVQIEDLQPATAAQLGIDPDITGALVLGLFPDGPAADAGVEQGDVIVAIDGETIEGIQDVNRVLRDFSPSDLVELSIVRGSDRLSIELELGQRPTSLGG